MYISFSCFILHTFVEPRTKPNPNVNLYCFCLCRIVCQKMTQDWGQSPTPVTSSRLQVWAEPEWPTRTSCRSARATLVQEWPELFPCQPMWTPASLRHRCQLLRLHCLHHPCPLTWPRRKRGRSEGNLLNSILIWGFISYCSGLLAFLCLKSTTWAHPSLFEDVEPPMHN